MLVRWSPSPNMTPRHLDGPRSVDVTRPGRDHGQKIDIAQVADRFASWARICPGNHESTGKRMSVLTGRGNAWLRAALSQVGWAAVRTKGSCYRALHHRHKPRGGPKKAIVAAHHAILVAIWHMFSRGAMHEDLGSDHFWTRGRERWKRYLLDRLRKLGLECPFCRSGAARVFESWLIRSDWGAWAFGLGVEDVEVFQQCTVAEETARRIEEDVRLAVRLGVRGTPGFVTEQGVFSGGEFDDALSSPPIEVLGLADGVLCSPGS